MALVCLLTGRTVARHQERRPPHHSVCTISVDSTGERGLLGVAFDPNFVSNNFVYVYYTVSTTPRHNRVSRFTAQGDVAAAGSEVVLFELTT